MKKILSISILISSLLVPTIIFAADQLMVACGGNGQRACGICDLFQLINNIIKVVIIGLVPIIAALMIVIAGFKMVINQNNSDVLSESKKIILTTIIGVVLIYASYAIVNSIFAAMGYAGGNPLEFNNIKCD
jgi:hypothetical protein